MKYQFFIFVTPMIYLKLALSPKSNLFYLRFTHTFRETVLRSARRLFRKTPGSSKKQLLELCPVVLQTSQDTCIVDRVYKINNTWLGIHEDILRKNCFPLWVIDQTIHRYVTKKINSTNVHKDSRRCEKPPPHFFKLPYVGRFPRLAQIKLRQLHKRYCNTDLDNKLFFLHLRPVTCLL